MTRIVPVIALGFLINPFSLYASPANYSINTQKTTITLSWHAFGDTSEARLGDVTGDIALNAGNDEGDTINVSIPVATLKASNRLLTWQMKGTLFLTLDAIRISLLSVAAWWHWDRAIFGFLAHLRLRTSRARSFWMPY